MANPAQDPRTPGNPAPETPPQDPATPPTAEPTGDDPEKITLSKAELDRLLNKVRSDEKKLRYASQENLTKKLEEEAAARAQAEAELASLRASRTATSSTPAPTEPTQITPPSATPAPPTPAEAGPLTLESIEKLLDNRLQRELDSLRDEAALRVTLAEAGAHRERVLRESGLDPEFADLVQGDTKEQIDASLAAALERQKRIEQSMSARYREEMGRYVPRGGFAPSQGGDGAFGPGIGNFDALDRKRIARIKDSSEFNRIRQTVLSTTGRGR